MKAPARFFAAILLMLAAESMSQAAEINALVTPAIRAAFESLTPKFEHASGHKLNITFLASNFIPKRVQEGGAVDFVVSSRAGADELLRGGKLVAGTDVNVGKSGVFLAVRAGAPKPDISSPDALKRTLLAARAVSYSSGASGMHFAQVLQRLGIAEEMKPKTRHPAPASPTGELVVSGEADIAVQQYPELKAVKGIEIVGPLPGDLQRYTLFTAGIVANSGNAEAAKAFLEFLRSEEAVSVIRESGLEPG